MKQEHGLKRDFLLLLITLVIMLCIFFGFRMIFQGLRRDPVFLSVVPAKLIELAYYYFFILLFISDTVAATGNIYTSDNMNLLLTAPISRFRLYAAKFIETFVETSILLFVFCTPAALAYCLSLDLGMSFMLSTLGISLLFLLIPVGLSIAVATLLANIFAFIWQRGWIIIIGVMAAFSYVLYAISTELHRVEEKKQGASALVGLIGLYDNPNRYYLPSRWASDLVTAFVGAPLEAGNTKLLLLIASACASAAFGFLAFDFFVMRVRSTSLSGVGRRRPKYAGDTVRSLFEWLSTSLPADSQTRAIILKDLSSLVRDRSQAIQLLLYLGFALLYVTIFGFMGAVFTLAPVAAQVWWALLASMNLLFSGFILTTVMTRLVYPSVSLEGRAFWILQVTPIDIAKLVRAKFLCWLPLASLISVSLLVSGVLAIGIDPPLLIVTAVEGFALSLGCTGLAIGLGAVFASFDWESPSQISVGFGTLVLLISSLVLVAVLSVPCALVTFLTVVPKLRAIIGPINSFFLMSACLFVVLYTNIVVASIACKRGAAALIARRDQII